MRTNYKFHAIAISSLCVIITLLYMVMAPTPQQTPEQHRANASGRAIAIYSATWGLNCNDSIQMYQNAANLAPRTKDENGMDIPPATIQRIAQNNVLSTLSTLCDGKEVCEFRTDAQTFGIDPMSGCAKRFSLNYRCYSYDALHIVNKEQGEAVRLDCTPPSTTPATAGQAPAAK